MITTTVTVVDAAAPTTPIQTSCRDCVTAYTAIAEMNRSAAQAAYESGIRGETGMVPLPVILEATCPWPIGARDVELCLPHANTRKQRAFHRTGGSS